MERMPSMTSALAARSRTVPRSTSRASFAALLHRAYDIDQEDLLAEQLAAEELESR